MVRLTDRLHMTKAVDEYKMMYSIPEDSFIFANSADPDEMPVWIQFRPDILSGLIWVQGYRQTTLVGKV